MNNFRNKKIAENKGFVEIFGIHAVYAALKNPRRIHKELVISPSNNHFITKKIAKTVKKITRLTNAEINKLYGNEKNHQGILLKTSNLVQPTLDQILDCSVKNEKEIILMLDHITDPQNIGSIFRTCALFNCNSIVVSKDNSPDITSSIIKTASGAVEVVDYIKVTNLSNAIKKFKKNNFWIFGLDNNDKNFIDNFKFPKKCLFILGAEGKGLRKLTKTECDETISIRTNVNHMFEIDSLNVSNTCSIILHEYYKKWIT